MLFLQREILKDIGRVTTVEESDKRSVHRWKVHTIQCYCWNENPESDAFRSGPGSWKLSISCMPVNIKQVLLQGRLDSSFASRIFIKLSVGDSENEIQATKRIWIENSGVIFCYLLLGSIDDAIRVQQPDGYLVVTCELHFDPEETADYSTEAIHPPVKLLGELECVGTLHHDRTKKTWNVPDFGKLAEKKRSLCSESFAYGTRLWQLRVSTPHGRSEVGSRADSENGVILSLKTVSRQETFSPFYWILSIQNDKSTVLRSADGVFEGATDHIILSLGSLSEVQTILGSDTILRVVCELRLLQETTDIFHADSKADIVVRDLQKLLTSEESSDAIVRVKGERDFRVHRAVLVARTPVFAAMFRHEMSESTTGTVTIADCEPDTFELFLQHVYTGRVLDLRPDNAISLYQVADKYQVDELKLDCLQCIKEGLSIASFCPTIRLALQYCETELTQLATAFFARNMMEIIVTVEWQNFMGENHIVANELIMKAVKFFRERETVVQTNS